jgi:hypothetical protein
LEQARQAHVDSLRLPTLTGNGGIEPPATRVRVVVTRNGIEVDRVALLAALPPAERAARMPDAGPALAADSVVPLRNGLVDPQFKRGGEAGFLITPLDHVASRVATALGFANADAGSAAGSFNLFVEGDIPARTVFEVLYTLGQNGFRQFGLVGRQGRTTVALNLAMETGVSHQAALSALHNNAEFSALVEPVDGGAGAAPANPPPRPTEVEVESEWVTVMLVTEGFIVRAGNGYLAPDCTAVGDPQLTIRALSTGGRDFAGLTRCIATLRRARSGPTVPAIELQIAADGRVSYEDLFRTVAAVRETSPGARDLFPAPAIGIRL